MPRRGSRAQLVHLLARARAYAISEVYGDHLHPAELYEDFTHCSLSELQEWAEDITPRKRGRPQNGSAYAALGAKVDDVRSRNKGMSVRAACLHVAIAHGVDKDALRTRYNSVRRRPTKR